jgi:tetratricopeptide (TPR) repeat protein
MMGIVQVGVQAMADRYAYISFVGLFIMLCWGAAEWAERKSLPAFLLPAVSTVCLLALAVLARQQINYWQSDEALWTHALQATSNNFVAESQLGSALAMSGRVAEGVQHFHNALALAPEDTNSNMGIAISDIRQKDYRDALQHFQIVAKDKTLRAALLAEVYRRMAKCYQALGEDAQAQESLAHAAEAASQ